MSSQQMSWCLLLLTVAMVTDLGYSRGLKKRPYGEHHRVSIDDSFDPDWSSMQSVDDVASWFDQLERSDLEDNEKDDGLHHHASVEIGSSTTTSTTAATTSTTTLSSSTSPVRSTPARRRTRGGSNHVVARSRQQLTAMTISTTSSPSVTPSGTASVTLRGVVDVMRHGGLDEVEHEKHEKHANNFESLDDPCHGVYCRAGRVCRPQQSTSSSSSSHAPQGRCVCADTTHCASIVHGRHAHRQQLVCGTDGRWYPSHCELHRTACITRVHLGADRTGSSCSTSQPNTVHMDTASGRSSDASDIEVVTVSPPTVTHAVSVNVSEVFEIEPPRDCTKARFDRLKTSLLSYHCARDTTYDCSSDVDKKKFVVAEMFDYYDWSGDNRLEHNEMISIEQRDHLDRLSQHCRLEDIILFSDDNKDGFISMEEFYTSFGVEVDSKPDKTPHIFRTTVSYGNSVELKCDSATEDGIVVWKRNGHDVSDLQEHSVKVFADGSLYIGLLTLHHIGNYTCHNGKNNDMIQTHILLVQMPPNVHVSPRDQRHLAGSTAVLKCRANGLPTPSLSWQLNDSPLMTNEDNGGQRRYVFMHNNSTLEVKSWLDDASSVASYKCIASNSAGTSQDVGTVTLEHDNVAAYIATDSKQTELVAVFHEHGYTVYELNRCHVDHHVAGEFQPIPKLPTSTSSLQSSTPSSLCSSVSDKSACVWGDVVNVRGKFIYAAQPTLGRVVVVEITDRVNPIEAILTDSRPITLRYVEHLDQVWVLCQSNDSRDAMVVMVIRDASETIVHRAVHIHPTSDSGFDKVSGLFLPTSNDLGYTSDIGYVSHSEKTSLQKLDLVSLTYTENIDLSSYLCIAVDLVFLPIGGRLVISCASPDDVTAEPKKQLVLDFVTDHVIETLDVAGKMYVSPDLRHLVVLSNMANTVSAYTITDDGTMKQTFDEQTELHLSHVTFFPSANGHGYSVFAASNQHSTVLQLDLTSGKVQLVKGSEQKVVTSGERERERAVIVSSSGQFASHVVTLTGDSVVVIDGARHHIDCEWQGVASPRAVVPLARYK